MNHERLNVYICKLKILSKLEPREKIVVREKTIEVVNYTTWNWPRLKKAFYMENRWKMITDLQDLYRDIESMIDNLVNNPPSRAPEQDILFALDRLRHDLDGSLKGLRNLILTHNSDKSAVSKLETLYEEVKILSEKIKTFFEKRKTLDRARYGGETAYDESENQRGIFHNSFDPGKPSLRPSETSEKLSPPETKLKIRLDGGSEAVGSRSTTRSASRSGSRSASAVASASTSASDKEKDSPIPSPPLKPSPSSKGEQGTKGSELDDDDTFSSSESPIQEEQEKAANGPDSPNEGLVQGTKPAPSLPTAEELEILNGGGPGGNAPTKQQRLNNLGKFRNHSNHNQKDFNTTGQAKNRNRRR